MGELICFHFKDLSIVVLHLVVEVDYGSGLGSSSEGVEDQLALFGEDKAVGLELELLEGKDLFPVSAPNVEVLEQVPERLVVGREENEPVF